MSKVKSMGKINMLSEVEMLNYDSVAANADKGANKSYECTEREKFTEMISDYDTPQIVRKLTRSDILRARVRKAELTSANSSIRVSRYVMDAYEKLNKCPCCHKYTLNVSRLTGYTQEFVCTKCKHRYSLSLVSEVLTRV